MMRNLSHPLKPAALLVIALMTIAACRPGAASPTPTPTNEPTIASTPRAPDVPVTTPPPPVSNVPLGIIESVRDEAARLSGVAVEQLTLVRADAVTWPDGSLGCPEPGQMYTQALVSGYWVVFEAGGDTYDFRVTSDGSFRRCELPGLSSPPALPNN